jgi:ubiquinone/menaquinone biosynthesis C-methylase UbiE
MPDPRERSTFEAAVGRHYAPGDVWPRIVASLRAAGHEPATLTRDLAAQFDEFHGGGRESTRALARFAGISPGMRILDVGSGVGGPARTLAAEFGADVTGVDLTPAFVGAATRLSEQLGLAASTRFVHGSALALPLPDASFDVVWSQNMLMNVPNKLALAREVVRVLRRGGLFTFEAVVAGEGAPHYPAFWAAHEELSFLVDADRLRATLAAAGLAERAWLDNTEQVVAVGRRRLAALARESGPRLDIGAIVPEELAAKMANGLRNNEEGRTRAVQGVYVKAD